jgi:hypothetical protein
VLQLLDVQLQVVANVKIELVTLEAQKDTLFGVIILQSTKFQDCKVNLKDAMGCPRNWRFYPYILTPFFASLYL